MNSEPSKIKLGNNIEELDKSELPASAADPQGEYPFYCSGEEVKQTSTCLENKPAVLMGTGGIASIHLGKEKYAYSTDTWAFRSDNPEIKTEFIFRKLSQIIDKINYVGFEGTGLKHLRKNYIRNLVLTIPSRNIQCKIVEILDTIDGAIEKTDALIKKYKQIKTGLMQDLFTRGVTPDGKLRPPREQAPELYKKTEIGWIPKEWEINNLKDKALPNQHYLRTGPFGTSLKGEHWVEDGIPVITIGALGEGYFIESELLYVTEKTAERLRVYKLKPGDVLFSRVADVGRSAVITAEQNGWIMSSNLMKISLDKSEIEPEFLQQQISFDYRLRKQIRMKVNSSGRDIANSDILNQIIFPWPEFEEQIKIVNILNNIDSKIMTEQKYLKKMKLKKTGLMQDLLTGKVSVNVESKEMADV